MDEALAVLVDEMRTAERSSDRQRAANSLLDRAGVPRQGGAPDAEVVRQALFERLLALRAAGLGEVEERSPYEVIDSEAAEQAQIERDRREAK